MSRFQARCLLALPLVAALTAPLAKAQTYYEDSSVYEDSWIFSEPLPAPRGQVWYHDSMPSYGIGSAVPQNRASPPYIPGYDDDETLMAEPEAIRPRRSLGRLPASAPIVGRPVRAPAPEGVDAYGGNGGSVMTLPPEDQPEIGSTRELPENLKRQVVSYQTREAAGTVIIDTPNTYLYLVLGRGKALRYGIGVGREGFTWSGTERISRMKEWPDWFPPAEMIARQPYLPRVMAGGPGNPLGARALYLGNTLYRIHGTNQPSTIGQTVSSGCIRLLNEDIEDLYSRVQVGTRVVVLPGRPQENIARAHSGSTAFRR